MKISTQDGYVILARDPKTKAAKLSPEVRELFFPRWFRDALQKGSTPKEVQEFEAKYLEAIARQLGEISENPQNWMQQGVPVAQSKAKFGNKSIPVKEVLLVGAAYTAPIFLAVSALVTGPAGLVAAAKATAAIGPATAKLYSAINTYSPTELDVHTAVVSAMYRNYSKTLKGDGATIDEIKESFKRDKSLVKLKDKDLEAVLNDMASDKKRMLIRSLDGGITVFKPNTF
jgi:hypothetical protein